jgi:hypothetical protein
MTRRRSGRRLALTQERPQIILRGLPRTANRSGQPQARGAAPERRPSPEAAETRPGHGEPSTAPVSVAHSPTVKDHSSYHQERSERQSPLTRGMGGNRNEWHGQSAAAPVLTAVPPGGQRGEARRSGGSSALPSLRGAGSSGLAAQREAGAVQPCSVLLSVAALTGPPTAAQTGVPWRPLVREPLPPATARQ